MDEIAGHRFADPSLLEVALTHGSYLHEHAGQELEDFERLEFLGDAVVDLIVAEELYRRFPDATEGELTAVRAQIVSSGGLAPVAARLGLPERARLGRGEEDSGGRGRLGLAASLFEAVLGAVYLDGGLEAARAVVLSSMREELDGAINAPRKSAKTLLQEWAQGEKHALPLYRVVEQTGPEHQRDFVVEVEVAGRIGQGAGQSKREAEEAAAADLLQAVGITLTGAAK